MRLLLALLLCGCVSHSNYHLASRTVPQTGEPVYLLESATSLASGFVVACVPSGDGYRVLMLTAYHFASGDSPVLLRTNMRLVCRSIYPNPEHDASVVEFMSPVPFKVRALDPRELEYGEELVLEGFPAGAGPYVRHGYSSGANLLSTSAYPGDSGGPISDSDGEVVGILVSVLNDNGTLITFGAYMSRIIDIQEWLQEVIDHG